MRCRREKLSAQQRLGRNVSERIVDKDNHARDAMKYVLMSWPEPSISSLHDRRLEMVNERFAAGDATSATIRYSPKHQDGARKMSTSTYLLPFRQPFPIMN
jgi:hypothetical protein